MIDIDEGSVAALWQQYGQARPQFAGAPVPPASCFGDSPAMVAELTALVVAGVKRATAALELSYADEGEPVPAAGDHWICADALGQACLVLQTTEVRRGVLENVDDAFAHDEGEGDRTRDSWLAGHRRFFGRELAAREAAGAPPVDLERATVIFERFSVVWPDILP